MRRPCCATFALLLVIGLSGAPARAEEASQRRRKPVAADGDLKLGWMETLRKASVESDRLRVRTGGICGPVSPRRTLFELRGRADIEAALALVVIDEKRSGDHCMCCGDPTLEFYRGEELQLAVSVHHGRSLRWSEGWPGDAMLSEQSAARFARWLADHGAKGPQRERERLLKSTPHPTVSARVLSVVPWDEGRQTRVTLSRGGKHGVQRGWRARLPGGAECQIQTVYDAVSICFVKVPTVKFEGRGDVLLSAPQ